MLDWKEVILRLVLACLLGGMIGWDRQRRARAAGLRTHMLVALGAALVMIVSAYGFEDILKHPSVILDPSRIAAQVVSGIGFLGAGAILILHRTEIVRGLTTAAGLWTVAAIGLAAGSGMYLAAVATTLIAWLIIVALKLVEARFIGRGGNYRLSVGVRRNSLALGDLEAALGRQKLQATQVLLDHGDNGDDSIDVVIERSTDASGVSRLAEELRNMDGVQSVRLDWPGEP